MEIAQDYQITLLAIGALAVLMLAQLLVADLVGIRAKHIPGSGIQGGHDDLLFRVSRTMANANESVGLFILAILFCVLSGASPTYTAYGAWGYFAARALYAICYYANLQVLRSVCFAVSLFFLASLLVAGYFR